MLLMMKKTHYALVKFETKIILDKLYVNMI
jgi:hypothetical protein